VAQGDSCCEGCKQRERLGRRRFLGLLGGGAVLALAGWGHSAAEAAVRARRQQPTFPEAPPAPISADPGGGAPVALGSIPAAHPGPARILSNGPSGTMKVALTIDDGYCAQCITGYVQFAKSSGIHITFNPNGVYDSLWTPAIISSVREMIADRQVQIGNHTWDHANLLTLSSSQIADELNRNEDWINDKFGVTSRPYFRPPYGYYNNTVTAVAGNLGYTQVLMWNGTFGDATVETPTTLIALAEKWLQPGSIVLGHLNHPTVLSLFTQIQAIIAERQLEPVTLDEMFGTARSTG
jgi:peptidoglycan/xylan/chitin deacetylase (PgdA/CDA1 family)